MKDWRPSWALGNIRYGYPDATALDSVIGDRPDSLSAYLEPVRKPSGRRSFCRWSALARPLQPAAGMRRPRRLAHRHKPSPQDPSEFSDRLLMMAPTFKCPSDRTTAGLADAPRRRGPAALP